jgi:hypothetical protein
MTIFYRALLKAAIRGTIYEYDIPSPPALIDADGEAIPPDREALEVFWALVREVVAEEGETRPSVLRELAEREHEDLADEA